MDLLNLVTTTLLCGGGAAAGNLGLHKWIKPLGLHPVMNYTLGSTICLIAASILIVVITGYWQLVIALWGIWVIAGAAVALAYRMEKITSVKLGKQAKSERNNIAD